jgi:hypothetical protein
MNLRGTFQEALFCTDRQRLDELVSARVEFFNANVPGFFDEWLEICSPDPQWLVDIIRSALRFLIYALRAISLPFVPIRPDWLSDMSPGCQGALEECLLRLLFCGDETLSALSSRCLSLFVFAAGDRAQPFFSRLLPIATNLQLPECDRFKALALIRQIYESNALEQLAFDTTVGILREHVDYFYAILHEAVQATSFSRDCTLACLKTLIPLTPVQFVEPAQQFALFTALSSCFEACPSQYPGVCSLVFALLTTFYGDRSYDIGQFLRLTFAGIIAGSPTHMATSFRFWRKVCRFEIDRETNNALAERASSSVASSAWCISELVGWTDLQVIWHSRHFAGEYAGRAVAALGEADDDLKSAAYRLLSDLMYSSASLILAAVERTFAALTETSDDVLKPSFLCLSIICNPHHRCPGIQALFASHCEMVLSHLDCSDDDIPECALLALRHAVECYGFPVSPDDLPSLLALLIGLISRPAQVASAAISCLLALIKQYHMPSPDYPISVSTMRDGLDAAWNIITAAVTDCTIIPAAILLFERFISGFDVLEPDLQSHFLALSCDTLLSGIGSESPITEAIQNGCLRVITAIFRAGGAREDLLPPAVQMMPTFLSLVADSDCPLIEEGLTTILAVVEALSEEVTTELLPVLWDHVMPQIQSISPTALEPALELVSGLCQLVPDAMREVLDSNPDFLQVCLDPAASPAAARPGSLRALSRVFRALPVPVDLETLLAFLGVCRSACETAFGVHRDDDDDEEEDEDPSEMAESILLGFSALIFLAKDAQDFISEFMHEWTRVAGILITSYGPPVPQRLLEAYFAFLEANFRHNRSFEAICGDLKLLPLYWGLASDDHCVRLRADHLLDRFGQWYRSRA